MGIALDLRPAATPVAASGLPPAAGDARAGTGFLVLPLFTLTILCSATLLFLVEPMVGRLLLPRAGNTPAVWNTSLLFFQASLLLGYGYAHVTARWLSPRLQVAVHLGLLAVAAAVLPLHLPDGASPPVDGSPVLWQLGVMALVVGLPFSVVSASSPLLQQWFSRTGHPHAGDPYVLYRASNLGSAAALVGYPLLAEPLLGLHAQRVAWAAGYGLLVLLTAACAAVMVSRHRTVAPLVAAVAAASVPLSGSPITWPRRARWMWIAALPSAWLLAVTAYLTADVAPIPLLWVIPLGVYLLSFTVAFGRWKRLRRQHLMRLLPFVLIPLVGTLELRASGPLAVLAVIHLAAFALAAVLCHRQVAEDRPPARGLTDFYLCLSVGGVLGGVFGAIVAPVAFSGYAEYPIVIALLGPVLLGGAKRAGRRADLGLPALILAGTALLAWVTVPRVTDQLQARLLLFALPAVAVFSLRARPLRFTLGLGAILLATSLPLASTEAQVFAVRDYFGVHRVVMSADGARHLLYDGGIVHGAQNLDGLHRDDPLTYYTRSGPLGDIMGSSKVAAMHAVGVIGLGTGTMACYATPGQSWRFYEIDPSIVRIAEDTSLFSFLHDCLGARTQVTLGDARLALQRSGDVYDLLVTDAFGGDAIPTHLLTREAIALELSNTSAHGLLAFHISNQHADLSGVVGNLARDAGLCAVIRQDGDVTGPHDEPGKFASQWVAMGRSCADLGSLATTPGWVPLPPQAGQQVWTDDYSAILQVIRWGS